MQSVRHAILSILAIFLCESHCHGQTLKFTPAIVWRHSTGSPHALGWDIELTHAFDHVRSWAGLHYSRTNGKAAYPDQGFDIHDIDERIGLSGGKEWLLGHAWILQTGIHADLVIIRRGMIGNPSSWTAGYNARGLGCGLSGRLIRRMGQYTAMSLGLYPGHSFVFEQEFNPTTTIAARPIDNAIYLGVMFGLVLQLASEER